MKTAKCGASNPASGAKMKKAKKYGNGGMPMNPKKKMTYKDGGYAKKK